MADVSVELNTALDTSRQLGAGPTTVFISTTTGYKFTVDQTSDDLVYLKTTDGGQTWGSQVTVRTGTVVQLAVWYDRWTEGNSGTVIHIAYNDSGVDDFLYRPLDTNGDSLGTETTIFAGATSSTLAGPRMSITRARGGNLYVAGTIDGGAEEGFWRSTDAGGTWGARTSNCEGQADHHRLLPAYTADNQDIADIFWDISANEISVKMYDDSANTHTETSISTGHTDLGIATGSPQYAAAVRWSDNTAIVVANTEGDAATHDMKVYTVTLDSIAAPTVTTKNDISTDVDDNVTCCICINQNNDRVYVAYLGKSDGSETWAGTVKPWYAYSDDLVTWTKDNAYGETGRDYRHIDCDLGGTESRFEPVFYDSTDDVLWVNYGNSVAITAATTAVKDLIGGGIIPFAR